MCQYPLSRFDAFALIDVYITKNSLVLGNIRAKKEALTNGIYQEGDKTDLDG